MTDEDTPDDELDEETKRLVDHIDQMVDEDTRETEPQPPEPREDDGESLADSPEEAREAADVPTDPYEPEPEPDPDLLVDIDDVTHDEPREDLYNHDATDDAPPEAGLVGKLGLASPMVAWAFGLVIMTTLWVGGMPYGMYLAIAYAVLGLPIALRHKLPGRTRVYKWMVENGIENLYKNTSANVIVMSIYGDRFVVPRLGEVDDEEGVIRTSNGQEWAMTDGDQMYRMGDAPVVWGVADAHSLVSPVGARVAEKIDMEDAVAVYNQYQHKAKRQWDVSQGRQAATPMADGGLSAPTAGYHAYSIDRWEGEPIEDVLVNWANHNPDSDGMIVSMEKHYELEHSQAGSETIKDAETRGRLAEKDPDGDRSGLIYAALLGAGLILGLLGPGLAQRAAGSGGNGGGTSLPVGTIADAMAIAPQILI